MRFVAPVFAGVTHGVRRTHSLFLILKRVASVYGFWGALAAGSAKPPSCDRRCSRRPDSPSAPCRCLARSGLLDAASGSLLGVVRWQPIAVIANAATIVLRNVLRVSFM